MYDAIVAIISINRQQLLGDCLESLFQSVRHISLHACVLDNGSTDGTADMIKARFPQVDLIQYGERRGFVANMNSLIRSFGNYGRYFVMLNNDTVTHPGALDAVLNFLDQHPDVAAATPRLIYPDGRPQMAGMAFPSMLKEIWRFSGAASLLSTGMRERLASRGKRLLGNRLRQYFNNFISTEEPWEVDFATGACLVIRREALQTVGPLSEDYVMYAEDIDWCMRARLRGWRIFVVPSGVVTHHSRQSFGLLSLVQWERSSLTFFQKYGYGAMKLLTYRITISILAVLKLTVLAILSIFHSGEHKTWIRGYAQIARYMIKGS